MVDERRLRRMLERLDGDVARLEELARGDRSAILADELALAGLKYRFVLAIQGCYRIAHHLCASEGWGPPRDNPDAIDQLGGHGAVEADLGRRLAGAVNFRNLLIHEYDEVDDTTVVANLDHVGDLRAFTAQVARWVAAHGDG